jgi:hypothetical protein
MTIEAVEQQPEAAPAPEQPPKKSSGYRRLQVRHRNLITEHEALREGYRETLNYQETILAELKRPHEEVEQWQSRYAELQSDVEGVLAENRELIRDIAALRAAQPPAYQPQPQPVYPPQPPPQQMPKYPPNAAWQPQRPAASPGLSTLFSRGAR